MSTEKQRFHVVSIYDDEYNHIHVVESSQFTDDHLQSVVEKTEKSRDERGADAGTLYHWGDIKDKSLSTRVAFISNGYVKEKCSVAIGSSASGNESEGTYQGEGEAFFLGGSATRITRGDTIHSIEDEETTWLTDGTSFAGAKAYDEIAFESKNNLTEQILAKIGGTDKTRFVAVFKAEFDAITTRSNGVKPEDDVGDSPKAFWSGGHGGHVIDKDSKNKGDLATMSLGDFAGGDFIGASDGPLYIERTTRILSASKEVGQDAFVESWKDTSFAARIIGSEGIARS